MEFFVFIALVLLVFCAVIGVGFRYPLQTLGLVLLLLVLAAGGCSTVVGQ